MARALEVRLNLFHVALVTTFAFAYSANPVLGQELIGLTILPGDTTASIVSINPVTGTQTPLMATPATRVDGASLAIDPASRRVFFVSTQLVGGTSLYVADLVHGTISWVPETASTGAAGVLIWDPVGNQLIGLGYLPGEYTMTVSSVDPATASLTPLVPTSAVGPNAFAFDPVGRRIFFENGSQNGPPYALNVVNITNRTISQPVSFPCCPRLLWDPAGRSAARIEFLQ